MALYHKICEYLNNNNIPPRSVYKKQKGQAKDRGGKGCSERRGEAEHKGIKKQE